MGGRTDFNLVHVPFRVCETITSFLVGYEMAGDDTDQSVKLVKFYSPLLQLLLTSQGAGATIKSFLLAKCAPVEIVNFLCPPSNGASSRPDLYVHLLRNGFNSFSRTIWLTMRNTSRYWNKLHNFEFVANEFRIIEKEKQMVMELDTQSYAAAHAMRLRVTELLRPDVLPVHAQEKHIRHIMRLKYVELDALNKTEETGQDTNTVVFAPAILSALTGAGAGDQVLHPLPVALHGITSSQPVCVNVTKLGVKLRQLNEELEHWMSWRRQYGNHLIFGNVCLSVQCFSDHCCMSARKRNADTSDDILDSCNHEEGPADIRKSGQLHMVVQACDRQKSRDEMGNTPRSWHRFNRFKKPCTVDSRVSSVRVAAGRGPHLQPHRPDQGAQRTQGHNWLYKLPDVLLSMVLKYLASYKNIGSLNSLGSCSKHLTESVNKLWLGPVLKHSRLAARLNNLTTVRVQYRTAMSMQWQAPCQQNFDSYSDLLHQVFQAYTMYGNLYLQIAQAVVQYSQDERQELIISFVGSAKKVQQLTSGESKQKKQLMKLLKLLDFRLLDTFAFDVLNLHEQAIHDLPPRAFYQGSKHQKNYRREFTEPAAYTPHRGAKLLYSLELLRNDLREQRRIMFQKLRAVEAYEVAHIQRLVDELRDTGLVKIDPLHACAALSSGCNTLLSYEQLQDFCNHMLRQAETNFVQTDKYEFVTLVVYQLRKEVAMKLENLVASMFFQMKSVSLEPCQQHDKISTFNNWRTYMLRLLQVSRRGQHNQLDQPRAALNPLHPLNSPHVRVSGRGEPGSNKKQRMSIRIATAVNAAGDPLDGFLLCYQKSRDCSVRHVDAPTSSDDSPDNSRATVSPVPLMHSVQPHRRRITDGHLRGRPENLLAGASGIKQRRYTVPDFIEQNCLAVHALINTKENVKKWPTLNTIKNAEILIVWGSAPLGHRKCTAPTHVNAPDPAIVDGAAEPSIVEIGSQLEPAPAPKVDTGHAFVVLKNTSTETLRLFNTFCATEIDVIGTLKNHATLTGKCAPCGRSLKEKNTWIGTTCVGHLPESWGQNRGTSVATPN